MKQYRVEDKNSLVIRGASQSSKTGVPNKYPTMQIWKPILAFCTDSHLLTLSVILSLILFICCWLWQGCSFLAKEMLIVKHGIYMGWIRMIIMTTFKHGH